MMTTKRFGTDKISCYSLKFAMPHVSKSTAHLQNISASNSMFPESWKIARVAPIFKEGDKNDRSNYKPTRLSNKAF